MVSIDTLFGLSGGFALSFLFWWWLNHKLVPSVELSPEIARQSIEYGPRKYSHLFAFKNTGSRAIINIRVKARLRIADPRKQGTTETNYFDIALPNNEFFEMKPGTMKRLPFFPFQSLSLNTPFLDKKITKKLLEKTITIDDVFDIYPQAEFFVHLICTDIYSNSCKVFRSRNYSKKDVRLGMFTSNCLDIKPLPELSGNIGNESNA